MLCHVNPSKDDDAAALDWAKEIKEDFASTEDNEAFVVDILM